MHTSSLFLGALRCTSSAFIHAATSSLCVSWIFTASRWSLSTLSWFVLPQDSVLSQGCHPPHHPWSSSGWLQYCHKRKSMSDILAMRVHLAHKFSWLELSAWLASHLAQSKAPITEQFHILDLWPWRCCTSNSMVLWWRSDGGSLASPWTNIPQKNLEKHSWWYLTSAVWRPVKHSRLSANQ